jgi:hypothetical protein
MIFMNFTAPAERIGYTRNEFRLIFQIYSQNVYTGFFRDFSFADINGRYFISFKEEAGKTPLITIEKRRLGPDRCLFVATAPGERGEPVEFLRSEKIAIFAEKLKDHIQNLRAQKNGGRGLKVVQ